MSASQEVSIIVGDVLGTLRNCDGYYECPRDEQGNRLGPLVGYAKRYDGIHQFVGEIYYNFAMAEQFPHVRDYFAQLLAEQFRYFEIHPDVIVGAPMGGILLSGDIGRHLDCRTIFLEKKTLELASASARERAVLEFIRHSIREGDQVAVGEDLVNNLSTPEEANHLIEVAGGKLIAISCACNRSSVTCCRIGEREIPIISVMQIPTAQYKQDDPFVAKDIAAGNVVWKPKNEWKKLKEVNIRR